jgi:hypothetical protein
VEDRYLVTDIKTTRKNIMDYSARGEFDEQTVPYGIVLEHLLGKEINEFKVSYLSAYIDLLEPKISMYPFTKGEEDIFDWHRGLCEDVDRMARYYTTKWWPRATNGEICFSFNKACWFLEYCSNRDPEIADSMIGGKLQKSLFHDGQEPWVVAQIPYLEMV